MTTLATQALPVTDVDPCCVPGENHAISGEQADDLAGRLKALADPTRLRLLSLVGSRADGEACVCELTEPVGLSQPTVSHHLKLLVDAGFLTRSQRGRWAYYRIVSGSLDVVAARLTLRPDVPAGVSQD